MTGRHAIVIAIAAAAAAVAVGYAAVTSGSQPTDCWPHVTDDHTG